MSTDVTDRACTKCGECFTTSPGPGRTWCKGCRREYMRLYNKQGRVSNECLRCGGPNPPRHSKFCSVGCRHAVDGQRRRMVCPLIPTIQWTPTRAVRRGCSITSVSLGYRRNCERCGDGFRVRYPSGKRRFCSSECRNPSKEHGPKYIPPRSCVSCGEQMYYPHPQRKRHDECSRVHHISRTMELYEAAYKTGRVRAACYWRQNLVDHLRERDGAKCALCGDRMNFTVTTGPRGESDDGPTIDHIVPRSLGGTNELANLQLAHWRCNRAKGNRSLGMEQLRLVG